jgi:hypothetical protein
MLDERFSSLGIHLPMPPPIPTNTPVIQKINSSITANRSNSPTVNDRAALLPQDRGTTARYVIGAARQKVVRVRVRCSTAVTEKPASETKQVRQFRIQTGQSSISMYA